MKISLGLKSRREELGMTVADLAEKTGMNVNNINRIEAGRYWISLKQYIILRDALGMEDL